MIPDSSASGGCRGCARILEDEKKGHENDVTVPENGSKCLVFLIMFMSTEQAQVYAP